MNNQPSLSDHEQMLLPKQTQHQAQLQIYASKWRPNADCTHIQIFDISLAFDSDLLPFSSPDVGYKAAVFQVGKKWSFKGLNALVLILKW